MPYVSFESIKDALEEQINAGGETERFDDASYKDDINSLLYNLSITVGRYATK